MANQINTFLIRPLHFSNVSVGRWQCLHVASLIYVHNPLLCYSDGEPRIRPAWTSLFGDLNDDSLAIHLTACQILDSFLGIIRVGKFHEARTLRLTRSVKEQSRLLDSQILAAEEAV